MLRSEYGEEAAAELVGMFRKGAPKTLEEVSTALAAGDVATVYRLTHSLKSSARMLGAVALAQLCERIETPTRGGDLTGPADELAALPGEVSDALRWLAAQGFGDA